MDEAPAAPEPGDGDLVTALADTLDELEVAAARFPDEPRFVVPLTGRHGNYVCYVTAEDANTVRCTSHCPLVVPEPRREPMARLLARLNSGLRMGAFRFDDEQGTVRFETAVRLGDAPLTTALLAPLLFGNAMLLDDWLPTVIDVTHLQMDPDLAWAAGRARLEAEDR